MAALYEEGLNVNTRSKELTPVDTGTLRGSTYTTLPEKVGESIVVEVGVGGPAKKYAKWVHELTHLRHRVGQAKFLETALKEASAGFINRIAKRIAYHFTAGTGYPQKQVIDHPDQAPDLRGGR